MLREYAASAYLKHDLTDAQPMEMNESEKPSNNEDVIDQESYSHLFQLEEEDV